MTKDNCDAVKGGRPSFNWSPALTWIPIAVAAKRLKMEIYEIAQLLIDAKEPPRTALKVDGWQVLKLPGLRPRMLSRKFGDPPIKDAPVEKEMIKISGFYMLHEPYVLAIQWPGKCSCNELFLWTDAYPMAASTDDLLLPIREERIQLEDIFIHPEDLEGVSRGIATQVKETLLGLVGTLAQTSGHDIHAENSLMGVAETISEQCRSAGISLTPRAIWNHLKAARELCRPMKTAEKR